MLPLMTDVVTSPPRSRLPLLRIVGALVVVGVVALAVIGIRVTSQSARSSEPLQLAAAGPLQSVHLANGTVYLGAIVGDDGTYLRLAGGAVIRPRAGASGGPATLTIDLVSVSPFNFVGDVLIPIGQVAVVANVLPGSDVANAYLRAAGAGIPASAAPGPS